MELVSHISGIALPWEKAVVQHFPVTFRVLLDAFLNENQVELENIKLEYCRLAFLAGTCLQGLK